MLDFNHGVNRPAYSINETTLQINRLLNAGLERENATSKPRSYLGASQIGEPCLRKVQYGYQKSNGKGFDGKTLRIFRAGHLCTQNMQQIDAGLAAELYALTQEIGEIFAESKK